MEVRPPKQIVKIEEIRDDQAYNSAEQSRYVVKQEQSLADHVLVVGKRYQPADFKSNYSCHLGKFSSGVLGKNIDINSDLDWSNKRTPINSFRDQQGSQDRLQVT